MRHLCFCLFYRTDTEILPKGKSKNQEASNLPIEHPSRSLERPWTLKPLYPALPNRIRKHPGPRQFLVAPEETDRNPEPVKETTKPEMPAKGNVR